MEPSLQTAIFTVDASQFITDTNPFVMGFQLGPGGATGTCDNGNDPYIRPYTAPCLTEYSTESLAPNGVSYYFQFADPSALSNYGHYSYAPCPGSGNGVYDVSITDPLLTPEPSTLVLLGSGALGLIGAVRRRRLSA